MKAIFGGLRYDTDKAILIGEYDNIGRGVDSYSDFGFWRAGLYKTPRSGRYFLAGKGGPMSRYSETISQNSWGGGSRIDPLTAEQAFDWAREYLDADIVEKEFAGMIEDA